MEHSAGESQAIPISEPTHQPQLSTFGLPQQVTCDSAAEVPKDVAETTSESAAEVPKDVAETTSVSVAAVPEDIAKTASVSAAAVPKHVTETASGSAAAVPKDITKTTSGSAAAVPKDVAKTAYVGAAEVPKDIAETASDSAAAVPKDVAETASISAAAVPKDAAETTSASATEVSKDVAETATFSATEVPKDVAESETSSISVLVPTQATIPYAENVLCETGTSTPDSANSQNGKNSCDPLRLPSVVVDTIVEHLDDHSLLTARQVCQYWKAQIVDRNASWKRRCQKKEGIFHFDFTSDDTCYMNEYLKYHCVLNNDQPWLGMWHADPLGCYPECREKIINLKYAPFLDKLLSVFEVLVHSSYKLIALTTDRGLVVVDLITQQVLWEWDDELLYYIHCDQDSPYIYAVTRSGDLLLISLDGVCKRRIDSGGKLQGLTKMFFHPTPSYRFLLVEVYEFGEWGLLRVCLVDVEEGRVSELALTYPDRDMRTNYMAFLPDASLSEGQLAVCALRNDVMVAAVVDSRGNVLHQASRALMPHNTSNYMRWFDCPNSEGHFITLEGDEGDTVKKYSVRCESSGVFFDLQWTWPIDVFKNCHTLLFGDQFVLMLYKNLFMVARLDRLFDDNHLQFSMEDIFPNGPVYSTCFSNCLEWKKPAVNALSRLAQTCLKSALHDLGWVQRCDPEVWEKIWGPRETGTVVFSNLMWLNGLSPATTTSNIPIATIIDKSGRPDEHNTLWSVFWSDDLWANLS